MSLVTVQYVMFAGAFLIAILLVLPLQRFIPLDTGGHRYRHLDGLRGIAAVAVVTCHVNQHLVSFFESKELPAYGDRAGILGVQVFFALTAFLFTERVVMGSLNIERFYIGRFRRIVPLYVFAALATVPIALYYVTKPISGMGKLAVEVVDIFTFGFLGAPALSIQGFNAMTLIGIAWTLHYEWKFYILLPFFYAIYRYSRKAAAFVGLAVAMVAVRDFYVIGQVVWPFFFGGILAAFIKPHLPALSGRVKGILSVIGIALIPFSIWLPGYFSFAHLLATTVMFLCLLYGEPWLLTVRPLRMLGTISYSVYLLQYLVLLPIVNTGWRIQIRTLSPLWKFMAAFSIIAILIPLACLTFRLIELPWMRSTADPSREPNRELTGEPDLVANEIAAKRVGRLTNWDGGRSWWSRRGSKQVMVMVFNLPDAARRGSVASRRSKQQPADGH